MCMCIYRAHIGMAHGILHHMLIDWFACARLHPVLLSISLNMNAYSYVIAYNNNDPNKYILYTSYYNYHHILNIVLFGAHRFVLLFFFLLLSSLSIYFDLDVE